MSFDNIIENQQLKTRSLFLVLFCIIGTIWYISPVSMVRKEQEMKLRAKQKAEILSYQILQVYKNTLIESGTLSTNRHHRMVASVEEVEGFRRQGTIGVDPWGKPFKYNLTETQEGVSVEVISSSGLVSSAYDEGVSFTLNVNAPF